MNENAIRNAKDRIFYDVRGTGDQYDYSSTPAEIEASIKFREEHNDKFVSEYDRAACLAVIQEQRYIIIKLQNQLQSALTMCEQPMLECDLPDSKEEN